MLSGAKEREEQREKARQTRREPQQNEEGAPPTEDEEMESAPLTGIHSMPPETLLIIFSHLPMVDLAQCATVCKQWHEIVTGTTQLWEGKRYRSNRKPTESVELDVVLQNLPPIQELFVRTGEFCIHIWYPRLFLTVRDISDTGSTEDGPRLEVCPNQRQLGIFGLFLPEDRPDASGGIGRLRVLEIECPALKELTFLRRCSDVLEELALKGCADLPSAAYTGLRELGNLRRLCLRECRVEVGDLEVALKGMGCLASLQLEICCNISDLSCLRHCEQLRELRVTSPPLEAPLTGLHNLPTGLRSLHLAGDIHAADELSAVARLPLLEELRLSICELDHLDFLRHCPRLRLLSLQFSHWPDTSQLSNLRHLEVLDLSGCRVNADDLSGALPSLTRLHTLDLLGAKDIANLQFLQHCPQLRTLSLKFVTGLEKEAYRQLCHVTNLQTLYVSKYVRNFVDREVRPCLPNVNIYS